MSASDIHPCRRESTKASQEAAAEKHELARLRVVVKNLPQWIEALEEGGHMSKYAADKLKEKLQ